MKTRKTISTSLPMDDDINLQWTSNSTVKNVPHNQNVLQEDIADVVNDSPICGKFDETIPTMPLAASVDQLINHYAHVMITIITSARMPQVQQEVGLYASQLQNLWRGSRLSLALFSR